jgi:serine/threonine-protein kinase
MSANPVTVNCFRCGTLVPDGARFCLNCGNAVSDPASATVAVRRSDPNTLISVLRRELSDHYDVQSELGRGGMAIVFRATEVELHRQVALKVLPPEMALTETTAERFKREARLAASLGHSNIIPIYRVGQAGGLLYIAMKFVEGRAVDAVIEQQGALPIPLILHILRCSSAALAYAHEKGIVHRDIKGANILIDVDGQVFVSDFGIARAVEESTLTASGAIIGTPTFMSPEQCAGDKVGTPSDQYSLGILAFQMITGQVPFQADSLMGIMHHHFATPVPDMTTVRDGVPSELIAWVERVLTKDATGRFPTSREMLHAIEAIPFSDADRRSSENLLRELAVGTKIPSVPTHTLPPVANPTFRTAAAALAKPDATQVVQPRPDAAIVPRSRSRAPLVAGGIAAAILVLGAGGWWATSDRGTGPVAASVGSIPAPALTAPPRADSVTLSPPRGSTDGAAAPTTAPAGKAPAGRVASPTKTPSTTAAARARDTTPVAMGTIRVRALPAEADASISIDGKFIATGFVIDHKLSVGRHRLRASAAGYTTRDTTITVRDDAGPQVFVVTLPLAGGRP